MKQKFWDKAKTWQKKAAITVSIASGVAAFLFLYPKVVYVLSFAKGIIEFQVNIPKYNRDLALVLDYIKVDKGLAKSQMDKVDSLDRYVLLEINGKETELKVDIRLGHSGDCKIFVKDGSVGMYGAYYNYSEHNWEYYDFDHKYHLTYTKK